MNTFDAVVIGLLIVAMGLGFRSGLLRALATIVGYIAAAPTTMALTPLVTTLLAGQTTAPAAQTTWVVIAVIFILTGLVLGALCRAAIGAMFGPHANLPDRFAGALLGAARIGLIAVMMVVIFDRIIPPHVQPDFLAGSRLRPYLSTAGAAGLKSLPPEVDDFIDKIKRGYGL